MSTTTTTTLDYGEPWTVGSVHKPLLDCHSHDPLLLHRTTARAVACVNACAGMADPAAEIASLRDFAGRTHEIATQLSVVVAQREAKQEKLDDILSVIPADAPCQHAETGETVADYILGLQKEVATFREERDEAREALSGRTVSCSQCNEAGYKLAGFEAEVAGLRADVEAMREAIREAHAAIQEARDCVYGEVSNWRAVNINLPTSQEALAKLQPFLKP